MSALIGFVAKVAGFFGLSQFRVWLTLGAVAAGVAFVTSVYVKGIEAGRHNAEMAALREQNAALERLYSATRKAEREMAQEAEANDARVKELEDYVQQLGKGKDDACLTVQDVDRLRAVIGR